ncbi:hypothetical protein [Nocardioides sp. NPDC006273]|uniref:hypothetical protein n=1 Tax=Nocardioides sp. NPDC006273 TaxID=3155598 RepID=UPI0033B9D248
MSILTKIENLTDAQKARIVKLLKQADGTSVIAEAGTFRSKAYALAEVTQADVTLSWETVGRGKSAKDVLTVTLSEKARKAQEEESADALTRSLRSAAEGLAVAAVSFAEAVRALLAAVDEAQKAGDFYKALGFKSWTAYICDVFKDIPALHELPKDQKMQVFEILWLQGMSQPVLAKMFGISSGTAANWSKKVDPKKAEGRMSLGTDGKTRRTPKAKVKAEKVEDSGEAEGEGADAPKATEDNPFEGLTVAQIMAAIADLTRMGSMPNVDRESVSAALHWASEAILTAPSEPVAAAA